MKNILFLLLAFGVSSTVFAQDFTYSKNLIACRHAFDSCNRSLLSEEDRRHYSSSKIALSADLAAKVEHYSQANKPAPKANQRKIAPAVSCAENGSCYGDTSANTGRPKTVAVKGYYRKDGTYVRGHYRSRPR